MCSLPCNRKFEAERESSPDFARLAAGTSEAIDLGGGYSTGATEWSDFAGRPYAVLNGIPIALAAKSARASDAKVFAAFERLRGKCTLARQIVGFRDVRRFRSLVSCDRRRCVNS
jgi:hypothetical protein